MTNVLTRAQRRLNVYRPLEVGQRVDADFPSLFPLILEQRMLFRDRRPKPPLTFYNPAEATRRDESVGHPALTRDGLSAELPPIALRRHRLRVIYRVHT